MTSLNNSVVNVDNLPDIGEPTPEIPSIDKKIPLVEVFGPTVQGEGAVIGQQTYFIRLGLCDYRCKMCDSMHAVDPLKVRRDAKWLTQGEIFAAFSNHRHQVPDRHSTRWVTFSGGNPCIHNLSELVRLLHFDGYSIQVETQGTFCPEWLLECDAICVSPKGPGMGEKLEINKLDRFLFSLTLHKGLYLKFVVFDERDLEVARMLYERYVLMDDFAGHTLLRSSQFFLSLGNPYPPGTEHADDPRHTIRDLLVGRYKSLLNDIMYDKNLCNVRFLPQWHVILYGNQQGV